MNLAPARRNPITMHKCLDLLRALLAPLNVWRLWKQRARRRRARRYPRRRFD
jgi:hypothetical protein